MLELNSQTIPSWAVALVMLYTGMIWLLSRRHTIRMDTRAIAYTLFIWGTVYGMFSFLSVDVELRGFIARAVIIMTCLSQSLPLTVSYFRSRGRGD